MTRPISGCLKFVNHEFAVTRLQDGDEQILTLTDSRRFAIDIYLAFNSHAIHRRINKMWRRIR